MPQQNTPTSPRHRGWFFDQVNTSLEAYVNSTRVMSSTASATTFDLATTHTLSVTFNCDIITGASDGIIVGNASRMTISDGDGSTNLIPEVQILGTDKATGSLLVASFNATNTSAVAPSINLLKGGNAAIGSLTAVAACEILGEIGWFGTDSACGDNETQAARIDVMVGAAVGANDLMGILRFWTTADGAGSPVEKVRISGAAATAILQVGVGGTSTGTLTLAGATSGTTTITPAAAAAGAYTLPAADAACCGFQLTCNGSGTMTWAAASLGAFKNDLGIICKGEALKTVVDTPVHRFTYDPDLVPAGTWAPPGEFVGIFGEEAPWAMQGRRKMAFSPVNAVGHLTAALQALNEKVAVLEASR